MHKNKTGIPAVIVGDTAINGLGVARNLGREGVDVHRIGTKHQNLLKSKYISFNKVIPRMDELEGDNYIRPLKDFAKVVGDKPVLFPLGDIHALKISKYSAELEKYYNLTASDYKSTATLVNKTNFYRSLQSAKIPHPRTLFPLEADEFKISAEKIGYPVFIKPEISPLFKRIQKGKGFVAHNRKELGNHLSKIASSGLRFILQEIIPGDATSLYGCAGFKYEEMIYSFCYQRIREYPAGFGIGTMLISIPSFIGQTMLADYLKAINYNGVFEAEFKLDRRDGLFKLIEINARPWWQSMLPTKCGLNIIKAAYDHAVGTGAARLMHEDYRYGVKWINLSQDYKAARKSGINLVKWLLSLRGEKVYAIWSSDDAYPLAILLLSALPDKILRNLKFRN